MPEEDLNHNRSSSAFGSGEQNFANYQPISQTSQKKWKTKFSKHGFIKCHNLQRRHIRYRPFIPLDSCPYVFVEK